MHVLKFAFSGKRRKHEHQLWRFFRHWRGWQWLGWQRLRRFDREGRLERQRVGRLDREGRLGWQRRGRLACQGRHERWRRGRWNVLLQCAAMRR